MKKKGHTGYCTEKLFAEHQATQLLLAHFPGGQGEDPEGKSAKAQGLR